MDKPAATPTAAAARLLEQVRKVMWLHHYSIHTERNYRECREGLACGEAKIEAFPTDLAVRGKLAPGTQNLEVASTMIDTHILQQGGHGVASPRDDLLGSVWRPLRERPNRRHAFPSCYVMRIQGHVPMVGMRERPCKLFPQGFFAG